MVEIRDVSLPIYRVVGSAIRRLLDTQHVAAHPRLRHTHHQALSVGKI